MADCKLNFTEASAKLAHGIYQELLKKGVTCQDLDYGYRVTNYAGKHCAKKDDRFCTKGKGDGIIEAEEVLEYALDNYDKYREVIEGKLGDKLPWLLDDFDPSTTFDAEIRRKVQGAITELDRIIQAKGIKKGMPKYDELMVTKS